MATYIFEQRTGDTQPEMYLEEFNLYGSDRLGVARINKKVVDLPEPSAVIKSCTLGLKMYELKNHLGNVLTVVSDNHRATNSSGSISAFNACVVNSSDYYPFGSVMPGRSFSSDEYRWGFNGKEKDSEVSGSGNQYDYGFRIYDPRIAKFLSVDPLTKDYPWYTPYQFAGNMPIWAIDLDGLEERIVIYTTYIGSKSRGYRDKNYLNQMDYSQLFPGQEHGPLGNTGTLTVFVETYKNTGNPTGTVLFMYTKIENNQVVGYSWSTHFDFNKSDNSFIQTVKDIFRIIDEGGGTMHLGDPDYEDAKAAGRIAISYLLGGGVGALFGMNNETSKFNEDGKTLVGGLIDGVSGLEYGDNIVDASKMGYGTYRIFSRIPELVKKQTIESMINYYKDAVDFVKNAYETTDKHKKGNKNENVSK